MKTKGVILRLLLIGVWNECKFTAHSQGINEPSFESEWLLIVAQNSSLSFLEVHHNLGEVPALVEVLVKSVSEPNKDFIFKGIGTAGRDDDRPQEYGSVVYIYNENSVRLYAPNARNNYDTGYVIYTGESGYWMGVNNQSSREALVKVRCWLTHRLPASCYEADNITFVAGSNTTDETYMELTHELNQWPSILNVRAELLDGFQAGWYTDGQGSNMVWFDEMDVRPRQGAFLYGYNNEKIRIWTSAMRQPRGSVLFTVKDGWGFNEDGFHFNDSLSGAVEVRAWCSLSEQKQTTVRIGQGVTDDQLEFPLPEAASGGDMFVSVKVKPRDGDNKGYLFDGIGGAMRNEYYDKQGTPCSYGGVVYAYNSTTLRVWIPDDSTGAALCIGSQMGQGINSQATSLVNLVITVWTWRTFQITESVYVESNLDTCTRAYRLAKDVQPANDSNRIATVIFSSNVLHCHSECLNTAACKAFVWSQDKCFLYNSTYFTPFVPSNGYEIWIME